MWKNQIHIFIEHYGLRRLINSLLAAAVAILVLIIVLELTISIQPISILSASSARVNIIAAGNLSKTFRPEILSMQELIKVIRPNLFKASSSLSDRPMADKTIERIKSQLKLQCVMEMSGEPVAYINIEGTGLKKCKTGDSINDLFTVLNVYKNSVEISIIDHKVTLNL
jgi:hypothetical protein